jgi:hypothetical protein
VHTSGMRFRATVELFGRMATGLRVPAEVVAALGDAKRPKVLVTVGGHTYRSTVAVYGDEYFLPLNAGNRASAGVAAGDEVVVDMELDTAPREVAVPDDLAAAIEADADAARGFAGLSYSHRREYVDWVEEAKRPETRGRRIDKAIELLREGRTQR